MPVLNGKGLVQTEWQPRINRQLILSLWRLFHQQPMTRDYSGRFTNFTYEHPAFGFKLEREIERSSVNGFTQVGRFLGNGWEMTFVFRRKPGETGDSIDWNVGLWLHPTENDFDHEWTLATLMLI